MTWLRTVWIRLLENNEAWGFVCIFVFTVMGYIHSPLWIAVVGGALFGVPSTVRLILMKSEHPSVPTDWRVRMFYLQAIGHGVAAAIAGFFMGWGIRGYWGPVP